jgi:hypothetical protein
LFPLFLPPVQALTLVNQQQQQYLREFLKKFKMALTLFAGALVQMIHEKT